MKITLELSKSIEDNADKYYEKAKKAKKKLSGVKKALEKTKECISRLESKKEKLESQPKKEDVIKRKKHWYEKFRWFISSEGFLCIGGRDATTNDILIKKHAEKGDLVFHTQILGSPFFIVKSEGKKIGKATKDEAAQACASFSRAWQHGTATTDVYHIGPDQVRHELGLPKGTFMIYGKRTYHKPILELAIGLTKENIVMCGPRTAVEKHCDFFATVKQGDKKKSDVAKQLRIFLKDKAGVEVDVTEVIATLPPGECKILLK
jgi:predicted ribosome quality control (RQC) complex YloA/Tae2 family protein